MSRGKYSPWCHNTLKKDTEYIYNCYGEVPVEWDIDKYDGKLMLANYDSEGFDSYGYSAFELDGTYAGIDSGIDRYGYTEDQYISMTDEYFQNICMYADALTDFKRNRDDVEVKLTENHDIIQTSQTQGNVMKLGEVKAAFDALENNGFVFSNGFIIPHAYRGDYHQVAFQPAKNISLAEIKCHIYSALNDSFVGYFSGHYTYDENTQVNLSLICAYDDTDGESFDKLVTNMLNEYHDADHTSAQKKVRKTKAQKQAEAAIARRNEQQKEWEEFTKDYPNRFAALMYDYFTFRQRDRNILNVVKVDGGYEFCSGSSWNRVGIVLTPIPPNEYSWNYMQSLRDAERPIEEERERIKEDLRKQQLRETALSKLTDEEKKALGIES
jgi:hypothetical protein